MHKEKVSSHSSSDIKSKSKLNDTNLEKARPDRIEKIESNTYLPDMRTNYQPSDADVESATGVDFPINMPNPAVDDIVVNNIAYQEFDYTQDMTEDPGID